jgi:hypothetical protein
MRPAALLRCGKRIANGVLSIHPQSDSRIKVPQRTRLRTVEILRTNIDPTMIDATRNQVEEVNGD